MERVNRIWQIQLTDSWTGAYLLHIRYDRQVTLHVGRTGRGKVVDVAAGHYVYVGSAMGQGRGLPLPRRLVRHATRAAGPPHTCRTSLLEHFQDTGAATSLLPRSPKRLFWNVDYLLEPQEAGIQDVFYVRSDARLEFDLADLLESRAGVSAPIPGLGAHDHAGHTHFLAMAGGSEAWSELCIDLERMLNGAK